MSPLMPGAGPMVMLQEQRFRGCLLGLAAGDAVGTAVEFYPRGSFAPVTDMAGGGPFSLEPGEWTDDTSMALCLATSLVESDGFDPGDQMARYCRWRDEGYLSSNGRCFDIGRTVSRALRRYEDTGDPYSGPTFPMSAGNGCIMRLAPVPMFYWPDHLRAIEYSGLSSRTTHGAKDCVEACRLFGSILISALNGEPKDHVLFKHDDVGPLCTELETIAQGGYRTKTEAQIKGTGYVIASLEAALWCFFTTDTFRDAILRAVNLGDDADTTGAVCGQLAGAYYGIDAIPSSWRSRIAMRESMISLADRLHAATGGLTGG